jgi:tRNA modification GTPase
VTVLDLPGPRTFTGEDTVELHLPGSERLVCRLLTWIGAQPGFRLAEPGEFTRRAYEAGKLDLDAILALLALIHAEDESSARAATSALEGAQREQLELLARNLQEAASLLEAALDFADHDIDDDLEHAVQTHLRNLVAIEAAMATGSTNPLGSLPRVLLFGPPNAGKSSLLNALVGSRRAQVAATPGTTRDAVSVVLQLDGGLVCELIDPAGIGERPAIDALDAQARARARALVASADLVLALGSPDTTPPTPPCGAAATLVVMAKLDLAPTMTLPAESYAVSTHEGTGLVALRRAIAASLAERPLASHAQLGARLWLARQAVAVAAGTALELLAAGRPAELAALELALAREQLGALCATRLDDEALRDAIFARFCIGK